MAQSKTVAIFTGAVGSVIAAAAIAWVGIGAAPPAGVTIEGPTITLVDESIQLLGHVNGEFVSAHWIDEIGEREELSGADGTLDWYCLGPGKFTVSLVAVL